MTVHLDVSQLVQDPRRSGIQRAERELIRHWPGPAPLSPCRFDPECNAMRELPDSVFDALCGDAPQAGIKTERLRLQRHLRDGPPIRPERLLSAELFLDEGRAAYHSALGSRAYWLVYDFIPWLHPHWFGTGSGVRLMPYLRTLRHVQHLAFISRKTREDCETRILRRPMTGPVIPMGADGLGLERQRFRADRVGFVMLGTIEHRKNALPVLQAFARLWRDGSGAELVMIGSLAPEAIEEARLIDGFAGERRFRHLRNLPDAGVREELRRARAMLFPSIGEGYGIPPMEALHAGIPVVVAHDLPALWGQPSFGQIKLDAITPDALAGSVRTLMDDAEARRLWEEAARMPVTGWAGFARDLAAWVQR